MLNISGEQACALLHAIERVSVEHHTHYSPEWLATKRHREALAVVKARIEQAEAK